MKPKACNLSSRLAILVACATWATVPLVACGGGSGSSSTTDEDPDDVTPDNGGAGGQQAGSGGRGGGGGAPAGSGGTGGGAGSSNGGAGGTAGAPQGGNGGANPDAGAPANGGANGNADQTACRAMLDAASAFVTSLGNDAAKKAAALLPFAQRKHLKYTPGDRPGLPLRQMTADQRTKALELVRAVTSNAGYTKAEGIRQLELVLRAQEGNQSRDPDGYFVAIHGTPSLTADWAVRWEGHHLSLSFTFSGCAAYASAPAFMGTNPATVNTTVQGAPAMGTRVLGREEDLARELATLLDGDAAKKAVAIRAGVARDVQDSPAKVSAPVPAGLPASQMNAAETMKLRAIVDEYAGTMAPILAKARLAKIEAAGWDKVTFLWSGSLTRGQAHYYRVVGPTFMIEYQNAQNNANHVHSVWRDYDGDFGDDILGKHLQAVRH